MSYFTVSREDWSLNRKGYMDQQRHQEKVKEAIRDNLKEIIADEGIIRSDGKKTVKVPIKSLQEYYFRLDHNKQKHVGEGDGGSEVGDIIAREGKEHGKGGQGPGAGDSPGEDYYEVEVDFDQLAEELFCGLELPNLDPKKTPLLTSDRVEFDDVRKQGIMSNVDKKRTLYEAIKRSALNGRTLQTKITPEDLRFKTWETKPRYDSNAVVLAMMDTSGSMGEFEKYIARTFFFWMTRFLRTRYNNVSIRFLAHHTEAKEVSEEEFFTKGESGGTSCSSVYELAAKIIEQEYSPAEHNIYPFHFTDGDNQVSDNQKSIQLVSKLLPVVSLFGYGEIVQMQRSGTLLQSFSRLSEPKFRTVTIRNKGEVYNALRTFFTRGNGEVGLWK